MIITLDFFNLGDYVLQGFAISNNIKFRVFDKNNVLQDVLLLVGWHHLCMSSLLAKGVPRR
jgi:hypothetical protein